MLNPQLLVVATLNRLHRLRDRLHEDKGAVTPEAVVLTAVLVSIAIAVGAIIMEVVTAKARQIIPAG